MPDQDTAAQVTVLPSPPAIADVIPCFIWRGHPSAVPGLLPGTIHANTYASVNLVLEGRVRPTEDAAWLPDSFLTGPFTRPQHTLTTTPFRSLVMVIDPRLLAAWFGQRPRDLVDSMLDAAQLLPAPVHRVLGTLAEDPATLPHAAAALSEFLPPLLPDLAPALIKAGNVSQAAAALGWSERHFHRKFVDQTGLSPRRWLTLRRFENCLVHLTGQQPLASTAVRSGYADQPHMSREFRSSSSITPASARHEMSTTSSSTWSILAANAVRPDRDESR